MTTTDPTIAHLLHLTDRAERGALTAREAAMMREELAALGDELADALDRAQAAEAERDRLAALLAEYVHLADVTHAYRIQGGHDCLGADLSCAGCDLRDRVSAVLAGTVPPDGPQETPHGPVGAPRHPNGLGDAPAPHGSSDGRTAARGGPRPWAGTVETTDGGVTVHIPAQADDDSEAPGIVVGAVDAIVLHAMLGDAIRATPEQRLLAAAQALDDRTLAAECFLNAHEKRLARVRQVAAAWGEPYHCGWLSASVLVRQLRDALNGATDAPTP